MTSTRQARTCPLAMKRPSVPTASACSTLPTIGTCTGVIWPTHGGPRVWSGCGCEGRLDAVWRTGVVTSQHDRASRRDTDIMLIRTESRVRSDYMRHYRLGSLGILVSVIGAVCVYGPTATRGFVAVARAAETAQARTSPSDSSSVPNTPWGHPDLQGLWNNSTTTPLERLTAEEQARGRAAQRAVREATDGTGAALPDAGRPLDRPSLVVDPPDGRIPPMKPAAIQRLVAREEARRGRGEADSWLDRNSWERCISRTLPVAMIPNLYNNYYQIRADPGLRRDSHRDDPRSPHHPPGRPASRIRAASASGSAIRGAAGRATRWSSKPSTSTTSWMAATCSRRM